MGSTEPDRVAMTHFTSQAAAAGILDGWRHEILNQPSTAKFGPKELSLRLHSRYGMNDPTEYIHDPRVAGTGSGRSRLVFPDTAFICCGAREIEDESLDRLDLWRAYGADGRGIAMTTIWNKKGLVDDGLDILEVEYVSTARFEELRNRYRRLQTEIDQAVADKDRDKAKELHRQRMKLEVGYKGLDYESEKELRIVYYAGDESGVVLPILTFSAENDRLRAYVTRKVKIGVGQTLSGLYVTIGPPRAGVRGKPLENDGGLDGTTARAKRQPVRLPIQASLCRLAPRRSEIMDEDKVNNVDEDKGVKVILNGTVISLPREVDFDELTKRAFPDVVRNDQIEWEVDYKYPDKGETLELKPGGVLHVVREMTINVSYTDKS